MTVSWEDVAAPEPYPRGSAPLSWMVGPPNFLAITVFASLYGIASFDK
jgi:hypothetical protein